MCFRSPISLALAAADAASTECAVFRRTRTSADDGDEEAADPDLSLDPADTVGLAWRDRNRAEEELEVASAQALANTTATWARASEEPAWPEMLAGMEPPTTIFMSSSEGERGQGGHADAMDLDREFVVVEDDTLLRTDKVE